MIRLHIPAIPYTITRDEYSHDAFTNKVKLFSPMMRSVGFEVYHYGVETSESNATKQIDLMTKEEWNELRIKSWQFVDNKLTYEDAVKKNNDPTQIVSQLSNWSSPLAKEFNVRFRNHLIKNYRSNTTDIVCIPLARTYHDALDKLNYVVTEVGIGYSGSYLNYRIFESYSWMSNTLGKEDKQPNNYWFVIPHAFNTHEFKLSLTPEPRKVGFLGRITNLKGCGIIKEIARRFPHVQFIICGQGDYKPYTDVPNVIYKPPIHGSERSDYLGSCVAFLHLAKYLEPFGCGPVEAQLCGTPVICSDWGGMVETVEQGITGLRGHTVADYCYGLQMALDNKFDRQYIRDRAVRLYDMYNLAKQYDYVFRTILDIHIPGKNGWYSPDTYIERFLLDKPSVKHSRIYLIIPYYGVFPNYFQLYLDSLGNNADILTVFLITDIDMSPYTCPDNLILVKMLKVDVQKRASKFILDTYNKVVEPEDLLKDNYKLVDFKIVYPLLFDDILKSNGVTEEDYVGWGDIDLIYGKLSNFIDFKEGYGILGGWHGHFTAIQNTDSFKNNFKTIPNYFELITDNSKTFVTDEIAYREPLKAYLAKNKIKMFYANAYFCDIVPPCFYHLSRPDHKSREKNFYDVYNSNKNINYLYYNKNLSVRYDTGERRYVLYCHLQKRKMDLPFTSYTNGYYINENSFSLDKKVIVYIHVCQIGRWKDSFNMIMDTLKKSKLYDYSQCIRLGVLTDSVVDMELFNDPKFEIIHIGKPPEYERPTLLHMRKSSEIESPNLVYYYMHTKGIRHYGTDKEDNVIDWIKYMLYWNVEQWKFAIEKLELHDTYGCNYILLKNTQHYLYSGNFWWANSTYIKQLPLDIGPLYNDPEFWISRIKNNAYSAHNSMLCNNPNNDWGHYLHRYQRNKYAFDIDMVYYINLDKRKDRNIHLINQLKRANVPGNKIRRYRAIDGDTHSFSRDELELFKRADFMHTPSAKKMMGNQLSHFSIFKDMLKNNYDKVLILQDDAVLRDNFIEHLNNVSNSMPSDCEIVNLGIHEYCSYNEFKAYDLTANDDYKRVEKEKINEYISKWKDTIHPCSLSYIITKEGAANMISHFETNGFPFGTDISFDTYLQRKNIFYGSRTVLCTGDPSFGTDIFNTEAWWKKPKVYVK